MIKVDIEPLKAFYGDCIFITIKDGEKEFTIMIDGGTSRTYKLRGRYGRKVGGVLKKKIDELKVHGKTIDLLIITHVDDDHIGGVLAWFEDDFPSTGFVRSIWMNDDVDVNVSKEVDNTSAQAASLKKLLAAKNIFIVDQIVLGLEKSFDWGRMVAIAPTAIHHNKIARDIKAELDNTVSDRYDENIKQLVSEKYICDACTPENDASMAFLLQTKDGETIMLLGDAHIDTIMDSLKHIEGVVLPLKCSWVKLSHHGSKNNFKPEFLEMVDAENYIISTNGMKFGHPDKEVIAYLIDRTDAVLWFNYPERAQKILTKQDKIDYPNVEKRFEFFE